MAELLRTRYDDGHKFELWREPPRTRTCLTLIGDRPRLKWPWTYFVVRYHGGGEDERDESSYYFAGLHVFVSREDAGDDLSGVAWPPAGMHTDGSGWVCLGSSVPSIERGEVSPIDAFWMTRFGWDSMCQEDFERLLKYNEPHWSAPVSEWFSGEAFPRLRVAYNEYMRRGGDLAEALVAPTKARAAFVGVVLLQWVLLGALWLISGSFPWGNLVLAYLVSGVYTWLALMGHTAVVAIRSDRPYREMWRDVALPTLVVSLFGPVGFLFAGFVTEWYRYRPRF